MNGKSHALFFVALGICLSACTETRSCNLMGCGSALTVEFAEPLSRPGEYRIDVVADGTATTCTLVVERGGGYDCQGGLAFIDRTETGAISAIGIQKRATTASVTVLLDGATVATQTFEPVYGAVEINGPGCGTCPYATVTMSAS